MSGRRWPGFLGAFLLSAVILAGNPLDAGAQAKPRAALGRVAAIGKITDGEKRIILNRIETFLSRSYDLVSQIEYAAAEEQAFAALDTDQCTEEACIRKIQEFLQIERMFILQIIREGALTQVSLSLFRGDSRRIEEAFCQSCPITELHAQVEALANRLIGEDLKSGAPVAVPTPAPAPTSGTGQAFIQSAPPGARIVLDGKPREELTPALLKELSAGEHTVALGKENLAASRVITIRPNEITRIELALERPAAGDGTIRLAGLAAEHRLAVDGVPAIPDERGTLRVAPGRRKVSIAREGFQPREAEATVEAGKVTPLKVDLEPVRGFLSVGGAPEAATVEIVGGKYAPTREKGQLPLSLKPLPVGDYTVTVSAPHNETQTHQVAIRQDQESRLDVKLEDISAQEKWKTKWMLSFVGAGVVAAYGVGEAVKVKDFNRENKKKISVHDYRHDKSAATQAKKNSDILFGVSALLVGLGFWIYGHPPEPAAASATFDPPSVEFDGNEFRVALQWRW